MNEHTTFEDLLPLYAAGQLHGAQRNELEQHLANCADCQADLALWMAVSTDMNASSRAVTAPPDLAVKALDQLHTRSGFATSLNRAWHLLRAQAYLVQREMWPASAAVMALGVAIALVSNHVEAIYFIAPLVAAASLTILFGPTNDPAYELQLSTPISPWRVMLARLSIVSAYNLLLSLIAALALLAIIPPGLLGVIILAWLGPMAFLSALALLLSLWIGTGNAVAVTYILWLAQYVPAQSIGQWMVSPAWTPVIEAYKQFWQNPLLLGILSIGLIGLALWSANRPVFRLTQGIG